MAGTLIALALGAAQLAFVVVLVYRTVFRDTTGRPG